MLLRLALALVTATSAVPAVGLLSGDPTVTPPEPTEVLDVPPHCRLLPPDRQPERRPATSAATGDRMLVTVYVPATTCNTPR